MTRNKELTLRALANFQGDDLERAERAFRSLSKEAMGEEYGESGRTRQAILDDYRWHRAEVKAAIEWVTSCPD